jgi:hypothetical protein
MLVIKRAGFSLTDFPAAIVEQLEIVLHGNTAVFDIGGRLIEGEGQVPRASAILSAVTSSVSLMLLCRKAMDSGCGQVVF